MMRKRTLLPLGLIALGISLLPLFARSAAAALIQTNGRPMAPAIAFAPPYDTYLIAWAEDAGTGTGLDLYAARLTRTGIVNGGAVPLVVAPGNQSDPSLVFSSRVGEFLVVYTDDSGASGPYPGGTATPAPGLPTPGLPAPPTPILPPPPPLLGSGSPADPGLLDLQLPRAGTGQAWVGPGLTPGWSSGPEQPPPPGQPTATPGAPVPPPSAPGSRDIWGVWAAPSGYRVTNTFALISSPADDTFPDLAVHRTFTAEQVVMVWREVTGVDATLSTQEYTGAFGHYLIIDGAKALVAAGGDKGRPSIALEESKGEYMVVWPETSTTTPGRDIFGRRLNSNAFPYGTVLKVVTDPADDLYPSIASLGAAGGYLLAWEYREAGQAPDIRVRQLNRNGIPYRNIYGLASGPAFSFAPDVASTDSVTTLVVWLDRNAASDQSVIGREVNRDGRPVAPERVIVRGGSGPSGGATPVIPPPVLPSPVVPPFPTP